MKNRRLRKSESGATSSAVCCNEELAHNNHPFTRSKNTPWIGGGVGVRREQTFLSVGVCGIQPTGDKNRGVEVCFPTCGLKGERKHQNLSL